jgi:hypothetical protein
VLIGFFRFDNVVTFVVMFNTVVISLNFYGEPGWYSAILLKCNDICTWVRADLLLRSRALCRALNFVVSFCSSYSQLYVLEMLLKWLAFGPRQYLRLLNNKIDFVVVVCSVIDFLGNSLGLFSVRYAGQSSPQLLVSLGAHSFAAEQTSHICCLFVSAGRPRDESARVPRRARAALL